MIYICLRGCEDEMCLRTFPDGGHPEECVWDSETDKFPIHIKTPPLPSFRPGLIGRVRVGGNGLRFVEDSVRYQDQFFVFKNVYVFLRPGTRRRANGVRLWADGADTSAARRQGWEAADNAPPAGLQQEVSMGTSKCIESSFSWNQKKIEHIRRVIPCQVEFVHKPPLILSLAASQLFKIQNGRMYVELFPS